MTNSCCFRKLIIARATTVNRLNYVPSKGELLIDSDTCVVYVGDGTTPGGNPIGQGQETLTILQRIGDILRYTDEDGIDTDIDLSDLVNDARVTSASLNPTTSIVTFTRNDASTFTLDLSALASQNALETEFTPCAPLTSTNVQDAICELLTQVQNGDFETLTSLQKIGNILRYTDEDGVQSDIDLSIYLDDTNLARLVSGTLNSTTGILTVTRDDSSTFTVDLSSLLDNQDASEVPFTPCGTLTSTNVQDALCELEAGGGAGGPTGPLCAIQLRRTTDLYGNGSPQSVAFDDIIVENNTSVLERDDTNTSKVLIKETGLYQITYSITHDIETADFQYFKVKVNGTTYLDQSVHTHRQNGSVDSDYYPIHNTFAAELTSGDYIELYYDGNNSSHLENCRIHFYVLCLKGCKGDQGATGAGSNIIVQEDDITVGSVTDTLNFEGSAVTSVVDEGSNKTTVTINGGGSGDVTSSANITDHRIVRGDGGAKGIQDSGWTIADDNLMSVSSSKSGYILEVQNSLTTGGGNGAKLCGGETLGDIALKICDADGTHNILEIEADQGYMTLGKTYAQTLTDNGTVYGVDNNHGSGPEGDFNTQHGTYRIGGVDVIVPAGGTTGQVLEKVNNTDYNMQWATPSGGGSSGNDTIEKSSTSNCSIASSSYTLVAGMTTTPASGTYIVSFSASGRGVANHQEINYALFKAGTIVGHTKRDLGYEADDENEDKRLTMHTQAIITVNGSETVEVKGKVNTSNYWTFERSMILIKVG